MPHNYKPLSRDDPRHGKSAGYSKGCRCEDCRAANAARQRYNRAKKKPASEYLVYRDERNTYLDTEMVLKSSFLTLSENAQLAWFRLATGPEARTMSFPSNQLEEALNGDPEQVNSWLRELEEMGLIAVGDEGVTFPTMRSGVPDDYESRV